MDRLESPFDRLRSLPVFLASVGLRRIGKCEFPSVIIFHSLRPKSSYPLRRTKQCKYKLSQIPPTTTKKKIRSKSFELANKAKWRSEITEICGELRLSRVKKSVCRAAYRLKAKERSGKVDRGKGGGGDRHRSLSHTDTDRQTRRRHRRAREGDMAHGDGRTRVISLSLSLFLSLLNKESEREWGKEIEREGIKTER